LDETKQKRGKGLVCRRRKKKQKLSVREQKGERKSVGGGITKKGVVKLGKTRAKKRFEKKLAKKNSSSFFKGRKGRSERVQREKNSNGGD